MFLSNNRNTLKDSLVSIYAIKMMTKFCYNASVAGKKRKKPEMPVFDSVRKPTAPPSKKIGVRRPDKKVRPSNRGAKHKKPVEREISDGDI